MSIGFFSSVMIHDGAMPQMYFKDASIFTVQVFHSHHFMEDDIPLSNVLLLFSMSDNTIPAFRF